MDTPSEYYKVLRDAIDHRVVRGSEFVSDVLGRRQSLESDGHHRLVELMSLLFPDSPREQEQQVAQVAQVAQVQQQLDNLEVQEDRNIPTQMQLFAQLYKIRDLITVSHYKLEELLHDTSVLDEKASHSTIQMLRELKEKAAKYKPKIENADTTHSLSFLRSATRPAMEHFYSMQAKLEVLREIVELYNTLQGNVAHVVENIHA